MPIGVAFWFPFHFNVVVQFETMATRIFMISEASSAKIYPLSLHLPGTYHDTTIDYMATS